MTASKVPVIINTGAGTHNKTQIRQHLEALLVARGYTPCVSLVRTGTEAMTCARQALRAGSRLVVAGGGDGTINAVASVLVDTQVPLGILPLGTLNHFAQDVRIPLDLDQAIDTLLTGRVIQVDVGDVNDHIFLNNSSLGLYPRIVRQRQKQQQRFGRRKWVAFASALVQVWQDYGFFKAHLHLNGTVLTQRTPLVFIGNNEYHMTLQQMGSRSRLDAGHLSVYVAPYAGPMTLLIRTVRFFLRWPPQGSDFLVFNTTAVVIKTRRKRLHVAMDGEVTVLRTPLYYRVRPAALYLLVPDDPHAPSTLDPAGRARADV
jgi:diacylglycerol kinase family enzyme